MDKKTERKNAEMVLRLVKETLENQGLKRVKPTFFARLNGPIIEFLHFHKFRFGPEFRIHVGIRVINDPFPAVALNGPTSDPYRCPNSPNGKKYNFAYHEPADTLQRCASNILEFVTEVAEPWLADWRNPSFLMCSENSPISDEARSALKDYLEGNANEANLAKTRELLKTI